VICAGIDAGSRATKVVLVDGDRLDVIASGLADQGVDQTGIAARLLASLVEVHGLDGGSIKRTVATGYGRSIIRFADTTVTEITCQAVGVRRVVPDAATIVDIGGQDSKLIRLEPGGRVRDFVMNDRCAAGTGRFLEVVAARLEVELDELGELARRSEHPASISSMCVVFAETEIVGLLAADATPEDLAAGVQQSIARRMATMAGQKTARPVVFTGGVALVPGMTDALSAALDAPVTVAPEAQFTCAYGAALLAAQQLTGRLASGL
jgi:predicted CoA-substrate-specific enzyme activase